VGSISIWHWLIVLVIIVLPAAAAIYTARKARTPTGEPAGVGGWLLYLFIGQSLSPVIALASGVRSFTEGLEVWSVPGAPFAVIVETALNIGFVATIAVTTGAMWRRDVRFPTLFGYQCLAFIVVMVVDTAAASAAFNVPVKQIVDESARDFAKGVIGGGIWYWYVVKSVRVKNTFTRRPPTSAETEPPPVPA
jgi:Protein of unknown function (DUF2569)